jgi:hypothetical protein
VVIEPTGDVLWLPHAPAEASSAEEYLMSMLLGPPFLKDAAKDAAKYNAESPNLKCTFTSAEQNCNSGSHLCGCF